MNLLGTNDLKEQQKINFLELKINKEKQKLDKKLTRQKILLEASMIEFLEINKVDGLAQYTADKLERFLTREGSKELMSKVNDMELANSISLITYSQSHQEMLR